MDGVITDHSDSDSGESWTILEHSPQDSQDVPDFTKDSTQRVLCNEKDEDTDGISIISDSDHDNSILLTNIDEIRLNEQEISAENHMSSHIAVSPQHSTLGDHLNLDESIGASDEFLLESTGKLKTYVHRRNKRLSTILNIIMLGSVITAVGVAVGHMWGAKNDCAMNSTPSVNKILSNLYKLQEENAFLRSKLKELTLLGNSQKQQQKSLTKQHRCKKVFEEPLNSKTSNKITKCLDSRNVEGDTYLESHLVEPTFETEFLSDVNKIKKVYQQNKHWLDDEISKRIQHEELRTKFGKINGKSTKQRPFLKEMKKLIENILPLTEEKENLILPSKPTILNDSANNSQHESQIKKVSYADSVKSEQKNKLQKQEIEKKIEKEHYEIRKKRMKKHIEPSLENVVSEEEIKKDDRYNCHKCKNNRKKTEKWRKKQLRRTKYDQFEINDQLKIFDENKKLQDNKSNGENSHHISNVNLSYKTESQDNLKENLDKTESTLKTNDNPPEKEKTSSWYEKRAAMRKDSRKELELELFGEQNLNDSRWYFRRMKRREQCRAKANNITNKKGSKLNMNFKMKY